MVANDSTAEEEAAGEMERGGVGEMTRDPTHAYIRSGARPLMLLLQYTIRVR